ncbi:MAG: hypothetical protein ACI81V_000916 [Lentimonas sp.]|jgi:hypothetical protein
MSGSSAGRIDRTVDDAMDLRWPDAGFERSSSQPATSTHQSSGLVDASVRVPLRMASGRAGGALVLSDLAVCLFSEKKWKSTYSGILNACLVAVRKRTVTTTINSLK